MALATQTGVYVTLQQLLAWRDIAARRDRLDVPSMFELAGAQRSVSVGDGTEFSQLRGWQSGDDARAIDWRVSARRGEPVVRQHHQPRECPLYIVIDQRPGMFFGTGAAFKSVLAAQTAALLGWAAQSSGDRVGGCVLAAQLAQSRCARGRQNWLQLLQWIVAANRALDARAQSALGIETAIDAALAAPRGARVAIISDFDDLDDSAWARLAELAARARLALFKVFDELERELPLRGSLAMSDGEHRRSLRFERALSQRYRQRRTQCDQRLHSWCDEALVRLHLLPAHRPLLDSLAGPTGGAVT